MEYRRNPYPPPRALDFLMDDEPGRAFLTSMVGSLFARSVYSVSQPAECLDVVGYRTLAGAIPETS